MVDYSKWKDIEVSDDEDDTHPNIDTPSLFRWRHDARVQRTKEHDDEKEKLASKKNQYVKQLDEAKAKVEKAEKEGAVDLASLKKSLAEIENKTEDIKKQWIEFENKEKLMPWNVDTISSEGFSKTIINTKPKKKDADMTEEEREERMRNFIKKYEKDIKQYGMLQKFDDSKRFLQDNMHLACEDTANYLVIWAINLEMEEKHKLMEHVAHQCICMNYIMELGKQMDVDPKACVSSFFSNALSRLSNLSVIRFTIFAGRIQIADPEYKNAFDSEVAAFKSRIRTRAKQKVEEAMKEYEEEEKHKRTGPGGLDPAEVFETLPEALQKCFESQDTELLQKTVAEMDQDEARYHMKRCVDSGLWVADAKAAEAEKAAEEAAEAAAAAAAGEAEGAAGAAGAAAAAEPIYEEVQGAAKPGK